MKIIVYSKQVKLRISVPLGLVGFIIRVMPESALQNLQKSLPAPYGEQVTKACILFLFHECISVLKEYRGLEILNVQAKDDTFISIKL